MTIAAEIDVGTGAVKAVLFRAERDKTEWLSRAVMRIAAPLPIAATIALEMIGPIPGTVISCWQPSSARARASISSVTLSMRSSR